MQNETAMEMFLEVVWSALSEKRWRSADELKTSCGLDDNNLNRIVDFLVRWDFAETRRSPSLSVRRKSGVISPTDVVDLLRSLNEPQQILKRSGFRIAERVACRKCGGRTLTLVGGNEVECAKCSERQWYAIEPGRIRSDDAIGTVIQPNPLKRILLALGFPQFAYSRNIPKPTRFFWFKCPNCKKTANDYAHGYARHFTCPHCGTSN